MAGHSFSSLGPTATLAATIAAWRADRSSVTLANRVDEAAAHVPRLATPRKIQGWWLQCAHTYDPVIAATLLDTLHAQARGTAAAKLRPRLAAMLAWPDDPRVALALALALHGSPFVERGRTRSPRLEESPLVDAIVRRILAIGDPRAIGQLEPLAARQLRPGLRAALAQVLVQIPPPRTPADAPDAAWQAVIAAPFDLDARLVLADAYLERGDPRGELVALQCAPHVAIAAARAAGRVEEASGAFGVGSRRIDELLAQHWYRWFGELGLVVTQSSRMRAGLLSQIHVGRSAAPTWAYQHVARHRELCALEEVGPTGQLAPAIYAEFLRALPRLPRWVHLRDDSLAALGDHPLPLAGVKYTVETRDPTLVIAKLVEIAPQLTHITFDYLRPQHMDVLDEVAAQYPKIKIVVRHTGW